MKVTMNFDLNVFTTQFISELDSHLIAMHSAMEAIENGFSSVKSVRSGIMEIRVDPPEVEVFKNSEMLKTFNDVMRSFQDFLDRLIASANMANDKLHFEGKTSELQYFLKKWEEGHIQKVAQDKSLGLPNKLDRLNVNDPEIRRLLNGYVTLRKNIEHHKGIADKDIDFIYRKFEVYAGNDVITALPYKTGEGESIRFGASDVVSVITEGSKIVFSQEQLENVIITLKTIVAVYLTANGVDIINNISANKLNLLSSPLK